MGLDLRWWSVLVDRFDGGFEDGVVGGGFDGGAGHQAHGPGAVVVGGELGVGVDLFAEEGFGEAAVGLVALHDEGACGIGAVLEFDFGGGAAHFDSLHAEDLDDEGDACHVLLIGGKDIGVGWFGFAGVDGVFALGVEIFEDDLGKGGGELEGGEDAGLGVVGVVAHGPHDVFVGWIGAIPLALGDVAAGASAAAFEFRLGLGDEAVHGGGAAVAHDLVHAHHAVVVGGHDGDVAGRPAVDVAVGPYAGHAVFGELRHLEVGEPGELGPEDGVEEGVLRRLAAVGVEEPDGLVEVVHDGRMPIEIPLEEVLVGEAGVVDVAVVVVFGVLAPVGDAAFEGGVVVGDVDEVAVVPVDAAIAAVGVGDRHDGYDDFGADFLDERRVFRGEAVGELHEHLGWAEFGAVKAAGEGVDGLGVGDDLLACSSVRPRGSASRARFFL